MLIADGYPLYRKRPINDEVMVRGKMLNNTWVVPHNPYLLAKYDCHINVEVCSTIKAIKYLYKYMYKCHDKIIYRIVNSKDNEDLDEIDQFQSARWVSPPKAAWRIYKFPLHEMSPTVITLQLHLDGCQMINFNNNTNINNIVDSAFLSRTMLTQYFWMNNHNDTAKEKKLLYKDFPSSFVWDKQSRICPLLGSTLSRKAQKQIFQDEASWKSKLAQEEQMEDQTEDGIKTRHSKKEN